jgi:hypothetical protein
MSRRYFFQYSRISIQNKQHRIFHVSKSCSDVFNHVISVYYYPLQLNPFPSNRSAATNPIQWLSRTFPGEGSQSEFTQCHLQRLASYVCTKAKANEPNEVFSYPHHTDLSKTVSKC